MEHANHYLMLFLRLYSALVARKWLKCVLMTHSSYLMTVSKQFFVFGLCFKAWMSNH
jgi:hypothetical protein